jgi:hypothetical protein
VLLTGTGTNIVVGSFTLTASVSSITVTSGSPASYNLAVTPTNNFAGTVVLNCTPISPAQFATCSLQPSSVTLGAAQSAVATLTTVTSIASASIQPRPGTRPRTFGDTALALLFPAIIFTWKGRTSRHPAWRKVGPVAWAILAASALLSVNGCGGNIGPSNLRYAPAGTYQYQATASSVSGPPTTQTVTLNLTVQ